MLKRVKAFLLDFFIGYFCNSIFFVIIISMFMEKKSSIAEFLSGIIITVTMFIYWIFIPYLSNGQTLGKYILNIKIVDKSRNRLSIIQLIKRTIGYILTFFKIIKKLNFKFDKIIEFEHERISNTNVIEM